MSIQNRPTAYDLQEKSQKAFNASRVAVSQAKRGISEQLTTHRSETKLLKEIHSDIKEAVEGIESYVKPFLSASGDHLSQQSKLDENDPAGGNSNNTVSGTNQIGGNRVRLESYQEMVIKTPLRLSMASQIIDYGSYYHRMTDVGHVLHNHLWINSSKTLTFLSDRKNTYITDWDVHSASNQRSAVGNRRLYSDYLSVQVGQGKEKLHSDKTSLDGQYGAASILTEQSFNLASSKGDLLVQTKQGKVGIQSKSDSTYYSNATLTAEASGNTFVNGSIVYINTSTQGAPSSPQTYSSSYESFQDLPTYKHKPTAKKVGQPTYTDANGNPTLQQPSVQKAGSVNYQRRQSYV
jgi:hypothetical protein